MWTGVSCSFLLFRFGSYPSNVNNTATADLGLPISGISVHSPSGGLKRTGLDASLVSVRRLTVSMFFLRLMTAWWRTFLGAILWPPVCTHAKALYACALFQMFQSRFAMSCSKVWWVFCYGSEAGLMEANPDMDPKSEEFTRAVNDIKRTVQWTAYCST